MERKVSKTELYKSNQNQNELSNLVNEYAPLVKRIAEQIKWKTPNGIELDDLIQSGIIGLLEAKSNYMSQYEASFKTYATIKIKYAIYESLRKHTGITRELSQSIKHITKTISQIEQQDGARATTKKITQKLGITHIEYARVSEEMSALNAVSFEDIPEEQFSDENLQNPLMFAAKVEVRSMLKSVLNELPKREQLILALYYNEFLGFKEIGKILDLTEARVSQLHAQLLQKLKLRLRAVHSNTIEHF